MELKVTSTWEQLNNKLSTNKFGAYVRTQAGVQITYETTPTNSTKGKLYNFGETINVDPSIDVYVKSRGEETTLVLDENFYEEEGNSSSSENIQFIPVIFKIEDETGPMSGGMLVPVLNIYKMDGITKINPSELVQNLDNMFRYKGRIGEVTATSITTGSALFIFINNAFVNLYSGGDFYSNSPTRILITADQLGLNSELEIFWQKSTSSFYLFPTNLDTSKFNSSSMLQTLWSAEGINYNIITYLKKLKNNIAVYLTRSSSETNDYFLNQIDTAWKSDKVLVVYNAKFLDSSDNVVLDTGTSRGVIIFEPIIDSTPSSGTVVSYLKVTLYYYPALADGTTSAVTYIPMTVQFDSELNDSVYKLDTTHDFYLLSNWEFYKGSGSGNTTNNNIIQGISDTSPVTLVVGDNTLIADNKSFNRVLLKLEKIGFLYGDWLIDLDVLRLQSASNRYLHFSISDMWFAITIDSSNNIVVNLDSSQTSKGTLRVNQLTFFGV